MTQQQLATILIDGTEYPVPTVDTYTLAEARLFKSVGDITLLELERRLLFGDQDALICLVMIARERAGEPLTLDEALELKISQVEISWPEAPASGDADPPPMAAAASEAIAAAAPSSETTRDDSGAQ